MIVEGSKIGLSFSELDFIFVPYKAGNAIRTRDILVGNEMLYH